MTRHADIVWILRHPELFSSEIYVRDDGPDLPIAEEDRSLVAWCNAFRKHELIQNDPPLHDRMRAVLRKPFSPTHLERHWRQQVREAVARLLDAVEPAGCMDVMKDLAKPLPSSSSRRCWAFPSRIVPWCANTPTSDCNR